MTVQPSAQPAPEPDNWDATLMDGLHTDPHQYDTVTRRVRSIFYTEFNRAYPRRPNREMENVCPVCGGDGCETCWFTGEVA